MEQYIINAHDELIQAISSNKGKISVIQYIEEEYPHITRDYFLNEGITRVCVGSHNILDNDKFLLYAIQDTEDPHITDALLMQLYTEQAQSITKKTGRKCTTNVIKGMVLEKWLKDDVGETERRKRFGITMSYATYLACRILVSYLSEELPEWGEIRKFLKLWQEKSIHDTLGEIDADGTRVRDRQVMFLKRRLFKLLREYGATEDSLAQGIMNIIHKTGPGQSTPMGMQMPTVIHSMVTYFDERFIDCENVPKELAEKEITAALESICVEVSFQFVKIPSFLSQENSSPLFRELRQVPDETLMSAATIAVLMTAAKISVVANRDFLINEFEEQLKENSKQEKKHVDKIMKIIDKAKREAQERPAEPAQNTEPSSEDTKAPDCAELERKIKALERENKALRMENYELNKTLEESRQEDDLSGDEEEDTGAAEEQQADAHESAQKKRCDTSLKYVFITRSEKLMLDLKERFPNCITTTDSYIINNHNANSVACVVFIIKRIHHGQRYKYQAQCKGQNVPYYFTKHTNVDRIEDELVKWGFVADEGAQAGTTCCAAEGM